MDTLLVMKIYQTCIFVKEWLFKSPFNTIVVNLTVYPYIVFGIVQPYIGITLFYDNDRTVGLVLLMENMVCLIQSDIGECQHCFHLY